MSIVTRGLTRPDALMPSSGLGIGSSVIVVIPLEQKQAVEQAFQSIGISSDKLNLSVVSLQQDVAIIEYVLEPSVSSPSQIVAVIDRLMSMDVKGVDMVVELAQVNQVTDLVEIVQSVGLRTSDVSVRVAEAEHGETIVREAIDRLGN